MNPEVKKLWLDALRSGTYQQGRSHLRADDKFCCLGVLCDLHAKASGNAWSPFNVNGSTVYDYLGCDIVLPESVTAWAGLPWRNPAASNGQSFITLAEWNDRGKKFSEIADLIEKGL